MLLLLTGLVCLNSLYQHAACKHCYSVLQFQILYTYTRTAFCYNYKMAAQFFNRRRYGLTNNSEYYWPQSSLITVLLNRCFSFFNFLQEYSAREGSSTSKYFDVIGPYKQHLALRTRVQVMYNLPTAQRWI